jgi:hypothetical protein
LVRRLSQQDIDILDRVRHLPDEVAVSIKVCALWTDTSERTWRRNPPIPTFPISPGKQGANLGLLRKPTRGEFANIRNIRGGAASA